MKEKSYAQILAELSAPFADADISWKPTVAKKKNGDDYFRDGVQVAGCTAHIDARTVMYRLDEVVGMENWSDAYEHVPLLAGCIMCKLTVAGVTKSDVGVMSNMEEEKGAFSDALKRTGVKFGIARYLYNMDGLQWLPYDGWKVTGEPPKDHWKLAGLTSSVANIPMDDDTLADMILEAIGDSEEVPMAVVVEIALKTGLYRNQNDVVTTLNALKEKGELDLLASYTVSGSSPMPAKDAAELAMFLVGSRMT